MLFPSRFKRRPESWPVGTILLVIVNVAALAWTLGGNMSARVVIGAHSASPSNCAPLRLLGAMFLHQSWLHLAVNMWFLCLLGFLIEGRLGTAKLLLVYLVCGFVTGAARVELLRSVDPTSSWTGAGGSVLGVLGAALYMVPFARFSMLFAGSRLDRALPNHTRGDGDVGGWPLWLVATLLLALDLVYSALLDRTSGAAAGLRNVSHWLGAPVGFMLAMLLGARQESRSTSEAKALFDDLNDYSLLSCDELSEIALAQPENTLAALHWMHKSVLEGGEATPGCAGHFCRVLAKMLREQPVEPIAETLLLAGERAHVPAKLRIDVASAAERARQPGMAVGLFEGVGQDPEADDSDQETACFQLACVYERSYGDLPRAAALFEQFVQRWPMSPLADQARSHLTR